VTAAYPDPHEASSIAAVFYSQAAGDSTPEKRRQMLLADEAALVAANVKLDQQRKFRQLVNDLRIGMRTSLAMELHGTDYATVARARDLLAEEEEDVA
jgi:hypothetical protein